MPRASPIPISRNLLRPISILPNLFEQARQNNAYRRVLFTGKKTQVVAMSIPPGEDIGEEQHKHVEQLLLDVTGSGRATVNGVDRNIKPGNLLIVRPGSRHNIRNQDRDPLKILTVYSPPNHLRGRVHQTKMDAQADAKDEAFGERVGSKGSKAKRSTARSLPVLLGLASAGLGASGKLEDWIDLRPKGVPPTAIAILALGIAALATHGAYRKGAAYAAAGLAAGAIGNIVRRRKARP